MSYSLDLRKRVVEWVEKGGSISKAAKIYQVGRATIYRWLSREDLQPIKVTRRKRKLDWSALRKDVEGEHPIYGKTEKSISKRSLVIEFLLFYDENVLISVSHLFTNILPELEDFLQFEGN